MQPGEPSASGPLPHSSQIHICTAPTRVVAVNCSSDGRVNAADAKIEGHALPHKRDGDYHDQDTEDIPTVYSEGLVPEGTGAFQSSSIQQQNLLQRIQQIQKLQQMQGRHAQFPLEQGSIFDFADGTQGPHATMQQHMAFQAMQDRQQFLFQQHQQHQLLQDQRAHQLIMFMQRQAQNQNAIPPPAHPSYEWTVGLPNSTSVAPIRPKFASSLIAQASSPSHICVPALSTLPLGRHIEVPSATKRRACEYQPLSSAPPVLSLAAVNHETIVPPMSLIGCGGKLPGQFEHPIGIAIDRGHIIVCDHDNHRVQVLRCWDGAHVRTFGINKPSKIEGKFHRPQGVAVDCEHHIIITDQGNHRIQFIDYETGNQVRTIGTFGKGPGQFANPCGLAIHPSGDIVICDSGNHRLQILDGSGCYVRHIGSQGRDPGQFKSPLSVACSSDGQRLIIAEYGNMRVQVLRWSDGAHLFTINKYFKPRSSWCPSGVVVDRDDRALIVNSDCNCIEMFSIENGSWIRTIELASPPIIGPITPETQLSRPRGLTLSDNLDIAVTDHGLNHVQVILKEHWYNI
jgi:sugar lactone lactonase YvrE